MTQFAYTPEAWKALVKKPEPPVFAEQAERWARLLYYCMGG